MKKNATIAMILFLVFSITGCSSQGDNSSQSNNTNSNSKSSNDTASNLRNGTLKESDIVSKKIEKIGDQEFLKVELKDGSFIIMPPGELDLDDLNEDIKNAPADGGQSIK